MVLSGCVDGEEFGGSGGFTGSNQSGISRGRDVCVSTARQQGLTLARVESAREYGFFNGVPRGVEVRMQVRRDPLTVSVEPRVCRYVYSTGLADISRT